MPDALERLRGALAGRYRIDRYMRGHAQAARPAIDRLMSEPRAKAPIPVPKKGG